MTDRPCCYSLPFTQMKPLISTTIGKESISITKALSRKVQASLKSAKVSTSLYTVRMVWSSTMIAAPTLRTAAYLSCKASNSSAASLLAVHQQRINSVLINVQRRFSKCVATGRKCNWMQCNVKRVTTQNGTHKMISRENSY